ncbi:MAG: DEAD/DEAH box helicase [Solirubrobacteraceae bacterium]
MARDEPLASFSPTTRDWFTRAFAAPTAAQTQAWPAIASGEHVLISAPTGSGKTLAAFLWAIDTLARERALDADGSHGARAAGGRSLGEPAPEAISLVYVSPLKALSYDIERNLRVPLRGIGAPLSVAVRTGDTPQRDRASMLRRPPDILITTPESLYLMLTGRAQELFAGTRWCIIDEIHAVAATKRGAHLGLTLERLSEAAGLDVQRIGLSATQNPLEEVGRFMVGPSRRCRIVDTGVRKPLDLQICVPVESMVEPGATAAPELDPLAGGTEATRRSIWPAIYPELLALVQAHRSTILFVNNRRAAERIALRLNEMADREIARAHHGSLAREQRTVIEEMLKAGELPCLVATSSLELGIDMGAVDLVIQVESPKSVARGLQRIGRAGHNVGDVSRGRIFPKFRADLLECAVVARRMREGLIETTVVPRNPLDVLAQQIVAVAAAADAGGDNGAAEDRSGVGGVSGMSAGLERSPSTFSPQAVSVDALYALVTRTYTFADLTRTQYENVLDMLDGRYPSSEFAELRPRITWDRIAGTIRARPGARQLAVTNAGTIPDRGLYAVTLPDGRRVGELDEEMVYEARPGQTFLLGASTWRIEEIGRDRVIVTPAPGVPGAVPFWKGDGVGRPGELGEAIGAFARWAVEQPAEAIEHDYDLDPRAARNLIEFLREQQKATRVLPSDRAIVVERFRDEIGDWRLCVLSPYGGRIHSAWALALSARIRDELGLESDAIWSDDGIIVHLPDAEEPPGADLVMLEPDEVEEAIVAELGASALFGARFRENAARALLIPRARPGKRTPLWQQRLKAQTLLEVARKYGQFPIILETYRECLRDVLDVPGLVLLLQSLARREISLVEVETATASPFASSLLFDYVATYMYEGDTPNAERRAAALSLDRDLLRELLGQEELRELIDVGALASVEADLQFLSEHRLVATSDALHDMLRVLGDLTDVEVAARVIDGVDASSMLEALQAQRRGVRVRIAGEERWIDAADAGLYRDALGVVPPGGLPDAFLGDVDDGLLRVVRRFAATHGPFTTAEVRRRYNVDCGAVLGELERSGELVRGELRPGGSEREWCEVEVLRRLRRASLAVLRKEVEPVDQWALARFMPAWQNVDRHPASGAGIDRLRDALVPLQGLALPAEVWEREVLPRRVGAYSPSWIDQLCAAGELVWLGAGALGRHSGRVALYFREDLPLLGAPASRGEGGRVAASRGQSGGTEAADTAEAPLHARVRERLQAGACFFSDLLVDLGVPAAELQDAVWDLVWSGEVTNDAFAPLRAPRLALARTTPGAGSPRATRRAGARFSARARRGAAPAIQGRWSLTEPLLRGAVEPAARRRAVCELLLERYGILTREQVLAEGLAGGFAGIYPELTQLETLGIARRGYFVEGLGGAQFALPGAVERLRALSSGEAMGGNGRGGERGPAPIVLSAVDPAQPYGGVLPWPARDGARRPSRVPGAYVVLCAGEAIVYVERGGRALQTLVDRDDPRLGSALAALVEHVRSGRIKRLALEKVDGEGALSSPLGPALAALGFSEGPRRLTLSA